MKTQLKTFVVMLHLQHFSCCWCNIVNSRSTQRSCNIKFKI